MTPHSISISVLITITRVITHTNATITLFFLLAVKSQNLHHLWLSAAHFSITMFPSANLSIPFAPVVIPSPKWSG
jgi:hypothetical protein